MHDMVLVTLRTRRIAERSNKSHSHAAPEVLDHAEDQV